MAKDMTQGKPYKLILAFSVPMLVGNVFQQLYSVVDTIVVGRYVSSNALAAIGTAMPVMFLCLALFGGLGVGMSIVLSQYYGAREYDNMQKAISTSIYFIAFLTLVLTVIGLLITRPLLHLMQVPPEIMEDATTYLYIIFGGTVCMVVYNGYLAVLRGIGDSVTPMIFLIIATLLNVVLDLWFVLQFGWDVAGVAIATVIAQGFSGMCCFLYVKYKVPQLAISPENRVFDRNILRIMLRMGIPSALQQTFISISQMAVQGLVNSYGPVVMAGYTSATKIDHFAMQPSMSIGSALGIFVGQNVGAGRMKRVQEGFKSTFFMEWAIGLAMSVLAFVFAPQLIGLFNRGPDSAAIIAVGSQYLRVVGMFYAVLGTMYVFQNLFRGAGDTFMTLVVSVCNFSVRVIGAYALASVDSIGQEAIWWAIPLGWAVADVVAFVAYKSGRWRRFAVTQTPSEPLPEVEV
jgi:putative MATE family efflux protein